MRDIGISTGGVRRAGAVGGMGEFGGQARSRLAGAPGAATRDGDVEHIRHAGSRRNVCLDGRLPATEKAEGSQRVRVVRVSPSWY
ncbi:hypothetical protein ACIRBX_04585 [Kitasatospora sp. NPDC096147]|uniref:hypothetical protein n=1 Tax=Kitasatospora sp. NPDC096147 TaxID=3364093 RepID=UPI0038028212